jgi:hypothetical protein
MAQAAAVAKPPAPPRRRRASATPRRPPYLLIAPAALLMLGFIAYPVLSVFSYSLQNHNPTKPWRNGFAGLGNFTQAFAHDPQFWDTLTFSTKWVVVEVGLQLLFGNLVEHLTTGAELLVPPDATGAFMRVVEAVRTAPDPAPLPAGAWRPLPAERRRIVPGIDGLVAAAADTLALYFELGASWAPPKKPNEPNEPREVGTR